MSTEYTENSMPKFQQGVFPIYDQKRFDMGQKSFGPLIKYLIGQ